MKMEEKKYEKVFSMLNLIFNIIRNIKNKKSKYKGRIYNENL